MDTNFKTSYHYNIDESELSLDEISLSEDLSLSDPDHASLPQQINEIFQHFVMKNVETSKTLNTSRDSLSESEDSLVFSELAENEAQFALNEMYEPAKKRTEEAIKDYIYANFPTESQTLNTVIYQYPLLVHLLFETHEDPKYICLAVLDAIAEKPLDQNSFNSATAFYQAMVEILKLNFLKKLVDENQISAEDLATLEASPEALAAFLEVFDSKAWQNLTETQPTNNNHFPFPDFKEFFSARHLERMMKHDLKKAKQILKPLSSNPKFEKVFYFLAGLLKENPPCLNALFKILDNKKEFIGIYALQLKIRCLEECHLSNTLSHKDDYLSEIQPLCKHLFNPNLWELIKQPVMKTFEISPQVSQKVLFILLANGLSHKDLQIRINAVQMLVKVQNSDIVKSIELLKNALRDKSAAVRVIATYGLGKITYPYTPIAIKLLATLVTDPSPAVKTTLAKTLVHINPDNRENPELPFKLLFKLLFDQEKQVAGQAIDSLCKLHVTKKLRNTLKGEYKVARKSNRKEMIITLFGELGIEKKWLEKIVLADVNYRDHALQALIKVSQKRPLEVIRGLINLLPKTSDSQLCESITSVIISLGKIYPSETLSDIEETILHSIDISAYAQHLAEIMGEIGATTPLYGPNKDKETFELFGLLLKKKAQSTSSEATSAPEDYAANPIDFLEEYLESCEKEIKLQIIHELGCLGTKRTISKQIGQILIPFLDDQDDDIRIAAIKALGKTNEFHLIHTAMLQSQRMQSHEFILAAIKVLGKIGKEDLKLAVELLKAVVDNSAQFEEVNQAVRSITLLGNLDHLGPEITTPLIYSLIVKLRVHQSCDDDASVASSAAIIKALAIATEKNLKLIILALETAFSARKNQKDIDCSSVEKAEFETMCTIVQKNLSAAELEQLIIFINKLYIQGNQRVKMFTLELITKLNVLPERIAELLFSLPLSNISDNSSLAKFAILALGEIKQTNPEKIISFLESQLYSDSAYREEACHVLSQFDLSSYPTTMAKLLRNRDFLKPLVDPLQITPFEEILKKYIKTSDLTHPEYLLIISHKCLAENRELFIDNNKLCFYSDKGLKAVDGTFNLNLIQESNRKYQKELILYRAQSCSKSYFNELAGDYYKQLGDLKAMIQCYKAGLSRFDEALKQKPSNFSQELQMQIGAVFSLGMCYQSGLGLSPEEMQGRLKKASDCYEKEASLAMYKLTHFPSKYLLAVCKEYGLGLEENKKEAQRIFKELDATIPPVALHFFNSSRFCFLLDSNKQLCAAGTIAVALASLQPRAINRDEIIKHIEKNLRPDYYLPVPYVQLEYNNNLAIRLPNDPIYDRVQLTKFLHLGLVGGPIIDSPMPNSKWSYNYKFVVEEYEVESFLRDKLGLHADVYANLIDVAKRTGRLQEKNDKKCTIQ